MENSKPIGPQTTISTLSSKPGFYAIHWMTSECFDGCFCLVLIGLPIAKPGCMILKYKSYTWIFSYNRIEA